MREILFRGKRTDNDEWIEGYYMDVCTGEGYILYPNSYWDDIRYSIGNVLFEVFKDTVGQFTGLTDKNGKKIFEGDIIRYAPSEEDVVFTGIVRFGEFPPAHGSIHKTNVGFYVEWLERDEQHVLLRRDIGFWAKCREIEVICNIHDNPELLGGAEDV